MVSAFGGGVSDRRVEPFGVFDVFAHQLALGFGSICRVAGGGGVETIEPRQEVRGRGRRATRVISDGHVNRIGRRVRVDVQDVGVRRVVPGAQYQPAASIDWDGAFEKSAAGSRLWIQSGNDLTIPDDLQMIDGI